MSNSKYSIISLFKEYDEIKIPIIQRDYAQGRESAKEIRKNFLNSIKKHLNDGLHLDFIYGSVEERDKRKVLILLDGQQRITTLFLLYWYAAIKKGKIERFQEIFCFKKGDIKSKLRYEVRASAEEFLDYIVAESNIEFRNVSTPSEIIKDNHWFYLCWAHDPTISGMLKMIDDIDETFNKESQLFDLLYNNDLKITFDFLELKNFGLTDDLYIKMNSRGKLLTPYENFKAKFEKLIEKYFRREDFIEIAKKFEKEYIDIFWKYARQNKKRQKQDIAVLTDSYMYRFFYNFTLNLYAVSDETVLLKDYSKLEDFTDENSLVSFFENVYNKKEEVKRLIKFLDHLSSSKNIPEQVRDILKESPTLWDRVRFYAYYLGIIEHEDDEHWYRVLKNLINNTRIDSLKEYINALKAIKKLSDDLNGQKILDYIKTNEKFTDFFSQNQQKEEMLKAELITKDSSWEQEIIQAENHWYLDGKIGFLIEFSKNKGNYDLEKFKNYRDKFIKLWDFARKGKEKENKENQILLYQALLLKGDYLPEVGQNKTFCSFDAGIRAKSENWHKVFESSKKGYLKELLDDLSLTENIEKELMDVLKKELKNITGWRKYFIENSNYIAYCEELQLRFNKNGGKIYLLKYKRMNGRHVELHSWHLFNKYFGLKPESNRKVWWKLEGKKACEPFNYVEYVESTSYEEPYILLRGFKYKLESEGYDLELRIKYENGKFQFEFVDLNGKDISDIDIKINEREIIKSGTFSIPEECKDCCKWLIEQISKK
ncbi:DUF262 domain-containing protein [Desulfurobacterium sp.]